MATNPKRAALAWAVQMIGQQEEPLGSNQGAFVSFCQAHTWLKPGAWPWCAAFAITAVEEGAGVKYPDPTAGAWDLLARAQKRGWARGPQYKAEPGDLVVFNVGSGHVGVVEQVLGDFVHSVDGNASDQVKRCVRPVASVRGYVSWPADGLPARDRDKRFLQVVGGESGRRKLVIGSRTVPLPAKGDKIT